MFSMFPCVLTTGRYLRQQEPAQEKWSGGHLHVHPRSQSHLGHRLKSESRNWRTKTSLESLCWVLNERRVRGVEGL